MSARRSFLVVGAGVSLGLLTPWAPSILARDHGVMGQTWGIEEPDLLRTIEGRLNNLQENGGLERMQQALVRQARERVMRPTPVSGITRATEARRWTYDPSIVVEEDVRDLKGRLIARRGQRLNPLDLIQLRADLVFVDGDDPAQLAWANRRYSPAGAKIIFVSGSPFEQMKVHQRRYFFDQRGHLTSKFGIEHVPAVVRAQGAVIAIEELPVPRVTGGSAS